MYVGPYLFFSLLEWIICSIAGSDTVVSAVLLPLTVWVHELSITSVTVHWKVQKAKAATGVEESQGQKDRLYN